MLQRCETIVFQIYWGRSVTAKYYEEIVIWGNLLWTGQTKTILKPISKCSTVCLLEAQSNQMSISSHKASRESVSSKTLQKPTLYLMTWELVPLGEYCMKGKFPCLHILDQFVHFLVYVCKTNIYLKQTFKTLHLSQGHTFGYETNVMVGVAYQSNGGNDFPTSQLCHCNITSSSTIEYKWHSL